MLSTPSPLSAPRAPAPLRLLPALAVLLCMPALQAAYAAPGPALPPCGAVLAGYAPPADEVAAHRKHALPSLHYPYGRPPEGGRWGVLLTLQVDPAGQVVCYRIKDEYGKDQPLTEQRRAVLDEVRGWRYTPFTESGHPVPAVLVEAIPEEESPQQHVAVPEAPLESVHLRLGRTACGDACPVYSVEIGGDGKVIYRGGDFVDVLGEHRYTVPVADVARLVEKLKASDVWSLRAAYLARVDDAPTNTLTLHVGSQEHHLIDYVGEKVGMPVAVADFEREIDEVTHTQMWITLDRQGLEHLKTEGFRFQSKEAADLLVRTVAGGRDEAVVLELLSLGAPLNGVLGPDERLRNERSVSLLDVALLNGQAGVVDALIGRGLLQSSGHPDPRRLDVAFRAAIAGGRLALVQKIWDAGEGRHPSLTYVDAGKPMPVTLLLSPATEDHPWEGLALVKWLEAQGCDLKAVSPEGVSLLHVAVTARDLELTRHLLSRGVKDSPSGNLAPALLSAQDEDLALLLLESGASVPPAKEAGRQYRAYVDTRHWSRVAAWLKAH